MRNRKNCPVEENLSKFKILFNRDLKRIKAGSGQAQSNSELEKTYRLGEIPKIRVKG